jgi:hypothetical protein
MSKIRLAVVAVLMLNLPAAALRAAPPTPNPAAEAKLDVLLDAIRANRKARPASILRVTKAPSSGRSTIAISRRSTPSVTAWWA